MIRYAEFTISTSRLKNHDFWPGTLLDSRATNPTRRMRMLLLPFAKRRTPNVKRRTFLRSLRSFAAILLRTRNIKRHPG